LELEKKSNQALQEYADLYFDKAITSVYFWPSEGQNFAAAFLIKKGRTQYITNRNV
jgi:hypothetical protein